MKSSAEYIVTTYVVSDNEDDEDDDSRLHLSVLRDGEDKIYSSVLFQLPCKATSMVE
jgi:hypothetical protein